MARKQHGPSAMRGSSETTDSDKETTEDSNDCNPLWYAWIPILQVCNKRSSAQVPCPQGSVTSFWSSALKRATGPHAACNAGASTKYQLVREVSLIVVTFQLFQQKFVIQTISKTVQLLFIRFTFTLSTSQFFVIKK